MLTLLFWGCGVDPQPPAPPPPPSEVEWINAMEDHYTLAIEAHDAVIQGDVTVAKARMASLAELRLPDGAPEAWKTLQSKVGEPAAAAASHEDLADVARDLAAVAQACGDCHKATGKGPTYPAPAPPDTPDLASAMKGHQWASERLWEGITGPWDLAWTRGTAFVGEHEVFGPDASEELKTLQANLKQTALSASRAPANARSAKYAELLGSCAACHQQLRGGNRTQ